MRRAPILLFLLLAVSPVRAGDEVRDAIREFEKNFVPGMSEGTRVAALRSLESVLDEDVLDAYDDAFEVTVRRVRELVIEKDDAVEEVKRLEKQIDEAMMRESERARKEGKPLGPVSLPATLVQSRDAARRKVESLQKELDTEYVVRNEASESLGRWLAALDAETREDVFRDVERDALRDRNWARRAYYVKALGGAPVPEATRLLYERLGEEKDRRVLPAVIDAVADQAGEPALDLLLPFLADERWQIRATAISALGRIGSPAAVQPLIDRLREEDGRLRGDLAAALGAITGQDLGVNPDRWQTWWDANKAGFAPPKKEDGEKEDEPGDGEKPDGEPEDPAAPGGDGPAPAPPPPPPGGERGSFYGIKIVSKRVLFVIDISNSMNQPAGGAGNRTKIDVAKYELKNAILGLADDAHFNIITYHHEVFVWRKGMIQAKGKDRRRAVEFVEEIVADGNTNIYDALDKAFHLVGIGANDKNYDLGADTIFLLSDGQPNRGKVTDPNMILADVKRWNSLRRVKIHTVGVGPQHNAAFMQALADSSGGTYVKR